MRLRRGPTSKHCISAALVFIFAVQLVLSGSDGRHLIPARFFMFKFLSDFLPACPIRHVFCRSDMEANKRLF